MSPEPAPSPWVRRFAGALAPGQSVLDLACGAGRHVRWLAAQGCRVTAVDRDAALLAPLADLAEVVSADLENGPWPLPGRRFDAVVVTHYLWRPLWPRLLDSVAPGGWLIYETFNTDQARIGRPARADFLLRPGELLDVLRESGLPDWRVVAYEHGLAGDPPRHLQRIAAWRADPPDAPVGHAL